MVRPMSSYGNVENEALENEDRSAKHPKLENEAPKTRKRSTQISKTEHPKIENEAPKHPKLETCPLKHETVPCQVTSSGNHAR